MRVFFASFGVVVFSGATLFAQCPAEGYPGCFLSPTRADTVDADVKSNPSLVPGPQPNPQCSDDVPVGVMLERGAVGAGAFVGGKYVMNSVQDVAADAAHAFPTVTDIPHYSSAIGASCKIGGAVAAVRVPTTLGETPLLGHYVQRIPVVGNTIAGPPPAWLVTGVAIDTYLMPKFAPCGYTESSVFSARTDFNSPPQLRNYVNYVAPLPYTHPVVYPPAPGGAQIDPVTASMEAPTAAPALVASPVVKIEN